MSPSQIQIQVTMSELSNRIYTFISNSPSNIYIYNKDPGVLQNEFVIHNLLCQFDKYFIYK